MIMNPPIQGLSIIIPTFAFNCTALVDDLRRLCGNSAAKDCYEIHVIDDGSKDSVSCGKNAAINEWSHCQFTEQPENTGKSTLLNRAIANAAFSLILLIDCDAKVCSELFISNYLAAADHADVICGSMITSQAYLRSSNKLRYKYETAAGKIRQTKFLNVHPYGNFTTFNVLFKKNIFSQIQFDETIRNYGYEDTLFGNELRRHCITIEYIENPLIHTGIDDNANFLQKTEAALLNLAGMSREDQGAIKIYRISKFLETTKLAVLIRLHHRCFGSLERRMLLGKEPSLFLFNLYKLGFYLSLPKKNAMNGDEAVANEV